MGAGVRWPALTLLAALLLLLLSPTWASFDFELPVKPVQIMERRISAVEKRYEVLGATCTLRLIGPMGVYYSSEQPLIMLNETAELIFELEVSNAPSGFEMNIERVRAHANCLFRSVNINISNRELVDELVVLRGEQLLRAAFFVKAYEVEPMATGALDSCGIEVVIHGNATFGRNVERLYGFYISTVVHIFKPEDDLKVDVRPTILLDYRRDWLREIILGVDADVRLTNNLESDLVLKEVWIGICKHGSCRNPGDASLYERWQFNKILRMGESEALKINATRHASMFGGIGGSGVLLVRLRYLTEMGEHWKTLAFYYNMGDLRPLKAAAGRDRDPASTTATSVATTPSPTATLFLQPPTEDLAKAASRGLPWIILILGLISFLVGAIFITTKRRKDTESVAPALPLPPTEAPESRETPKRPAEAGLPILEPPPSRAPPFLRQLYDSYQSFAGFMMRNQPSEALLTLMNGLYAALRQWIQSANLVEPSQSGDIFSDTIRCASVLYNHALLSFPEFDAIAKIVITIRGERVTPELALEISRTYSELYASLLRSTTSKE